MKRHKTPTYKVYFHLRDHEADEVEAGEACVTYCLRTAIGELMSTRTSACDGISGVEASASPMAGKFWICVDNGMEFETGYTESRMLHFADWVTTSSRKRIARLVGVNHS